MPKTEGLYAVFRLDAGNVAAALEAIENHLGRVERAAASAGDRWEQTRLLEGSEAGPSRFSEGSETLQILLREGLEAGGSDLPDSIHSLLREGVEAGLSGLLLSSAEAGASGLLKESGAASLSALPEMDTASRAMDTASRVLDALALRGGALPAGQPAEALPDPRAIGQAMAESLLERGGGHIDLYLDAEKVGEGVADAVSLRLAEKTTAGRTEFL